MNTSIDTVEQNIKYAEKKSKIRINYNDFILATLHRGENVDNKETFSSIIQGLLNSKANIVLTAHPRTIKRMKQFGFYSRITNSKTISLLPAVGYFDMLYLMKKCDFIVSDSGGIQEEATSNKIRKKVLVVRKTTDRPEAVKAGFSELIGTNTKKITQAIKRNLKNSTITSHSNPYGRGNASQKIIKILQKTF